MSCDLVVVRCCATLVGLALLCNVAVAQSGNRSSTVLENISKSGARVTQQSQNPEGVPPAVDESTLLTEGYSDGYFAHPSDGYSQPSGGGCGFSECQHGCGPVESCGPECAQGCHECFPSRKSKLARLKDWLYDRRKPVTGFCVEEIQYGANAGPPSYDYNSHGAWWTGNSFGPGQGKLAALKASLAQRRANRRAMRQSSCGCRECSAAGGDCGSGSAYSMHPGSGSELGYDANGCDSGCCTPPAMPYSNQDLGGSVGSGGMDSYPLYEQVVPPVATPSAKPTLKKKE